MQQGADVLRILAYYVWQDEGSPSDTKWLLNMFDFIEGLIESHGILNQRGKINRFHLHLKATCFDAGNAQQTTKC